MGNSLKHALAWQAKQKFDFRIIYFDEKGKPITYTDITRAVRWKLIGKIRRVHMGEIASYIRGLRDNGGQCALPGLPPYVAEWNGAILIECKQTGELSMLLPRSTF